MAQFCSCEQGDLSDAPVCTAWPYQHAEEFPWLSLAAVVAAVVANSSKKQTSELIQSRSCWSREAPGHNGAAPSPTLQQVWSHLQPFPAATSSCVLSFTSHSLPLHFLYLAISWFLSRLPKDKAFTASLIQQLMQTHQNPDRNYFSTCSLLLMPH